MQFTFFISKGNSWKSLALKFRQESTTTTKKERVRETNQQSFFHSYQFLSISLMELEPLQKTKHLPTEMDR